LTVLTDEILVAGCRSLAEIQAAIAAAIASKMPVLLTIEKLASTVDGVTMPFDVDALKLASWLVLDIGFIDVPAIVYIRCQCCGQAG
jgi:hypothetical protein